MVFYVNMDIFLGVVIAPHWVMGATYASIVFVLGACVGSFLNVVIYRVPNHISVSKPARSFCPSCKRQIAWYENLPLISWLALRGKCSGCGSTISFRYILVELLTALLYLATWFFFLETRGLGVVIAYWVLLSLFVAATFIDFEHFIIPDSVTLGGAVAGMVFATAVPELLNEGDDHLRGFLMSLAGAAAGVAILRAVVELGKLAFGRKKFEAEEGTTTKWTITQDEDKGEEEAIFRLHGKDGETEDHLWSDIFFREKRDKMILQCPEATIKGETLKDVELVIFFNRVIHGEREWLIEDLDRLDGTMTRVVIPREAMGMGDVKFMACIGAFLGWQGVLFTIFAGSVSGAVVGLLAKISGKQEWGQRLPFGPYLVLGAVLWMFYGPPLLDWYLGQVLGA
jgi:leader peptidase (prepilin peptidase)/N-methyltransferase